MNELAIDPINYWVTLIRLLPLIHVHLFVIPFYEFIKVVVGA